MLTFDEEVVLEFVGERLESRKQRIKTDFK